ncbi:MAG TPA: hypothetical protein PLD32_13015 [Saprospiraceae bacterium]|nr:hypothetical protein [Saprospiraceae bacterium]
MSRKHGKQSTNLNDVLVTLIYKGQLPAFLIFIIAVIMIIRLPVNEIKELFLKIIDELIHYHLLGWALAVITAILSVIYNIKLRTEYSKEMNRVTDEKSKLQQNKFKNRLGSSNH